MPKMTTDDLLKHLGLEIGKEYVCSVNPPVKFTVLGIARHSRGVVSVIMDGKTRDLDLIELVDREVNEL